MEHNIDLEAQRWMQKISYFCVSINDNLRELSSFIYLWEKLLTYDDLDNKENLFAWLVYFIAIWLVVFVRLISL